MELPWSVVYSSTICSSPVFPNPPLLLVESGKTIEMLLTVAVGSDIDTCRTGVIRMQGQRKMND